ncbi:expressed unknown protein [Seminavis robusta]|uniref:Uncharacterized protein n=1 Tax=Seminavis robusta TaxID=568900 RepID=A0A9N8DAC2_9STRA|nr:expressed unknown protein [Seminavis robusta]|eukprot:Sro14_g010550.1 n/a (293) ;mRNA; f:80233-81111
MAAKQASRSNSTKKMSKSSKSSSPSTSPRSDKELLKSMGEEAFHQSFCRLPNEEPMHKWDTDEVEAHHQRMKKLDKKLAKANDEIARLKAMLRQEDEKCEEQLEQMAQREQDAWQGIRDFEEQQQEAQKEEMSNKIQFSQLQAKLGANMQKIKDLRCESTLANKDLRKMEKQMDKLKQHNVRLEGQSADLFSSYSELCNSSVFEESNLLHDIQEEAKLDFQGYKEAVKAMQERYMLEAEQRLNLQKTMAEILHTIQSDSKSGKLANICLDIGLECEKRATELIAAVQAEHGQ